MEEAKGSRREIRERDMLGLEEELGYLFDSGYEMGVGDVREYYEVRARYSLVSVLSWIAIGLISLGIFSGLMLSWSSIPDVVRLVGLFLLVFGSYGFGYRVFGGGRDLVSRLLIGFSLVVSGGLLYEVDHQFGLSLGDSMIFGLWSGLVLVLMMFVARKRGLVDVRYGWMLTLLMFVVLFSGDYFGGDSIPTIGILAIGQFMVMREMYGIRVWNRLSEMMYGLVYLYILLVNVVMVSGLGYEWRDVIGVGFLMLAGYVLMYVGRDSAFRRDWGMLQCRAIEVVGTLLFVVFGIVLSMDTTWYGVFDYGVMESIMPWLVAILLIGVPLTYLRDGGVLNVVAVIVVMYRYYIDYGLAYLPGYVFFIGNGVVLLLVAYLIARGVRKRRLADEREVRIHVMGYVTREELEEIAEEDREIDRRVLEELKEFREKRVVEIGREVRDEISARRNGLF